MKKDRNCGAPYPLYPMYGNMMQMPMMEPVIGMMPSASDNTSLTNKINSLEQRVTNLENIINKTYSNSYNSSNYQMM